ncbi:hypothetical protein COLO4_19202 [Corchorus olitorius]|uniref:Uncharacterized protein n=1 Tax=Corchorus olitorius TaxID=93759 RepID=A0A1R3J6E2_9ROSI|nr:hypothetical protein COLO4_19202 [Corchorus olitorius]
MDDISVSKNGDVKLAVKQSCALDDDLNSHYQVYLDCLASLIHFMCKPDISSKPPTPPMVLSPEIRNFLTLCETVESFGSHRELILKHPIFWNGDKLMQFFLALRVHHFKIPKSYDSIKILPCYEHHNLQWRDKVKACFRLVGFGLYLGECYAYDNADDTKYTNTVGGFLWFLRNLCT